MSNHFIRARAILGVRDVETSAAFYERALGFRVVTRMGEPTMFASLVRDEAGLSLVRTDEPAVASFACCYFDVEGVGELHARCVAEGVEIVHPLTRQPWGNVDFVVIDPDGHRIAIGEPHANDPHP